MNIVDKRKLRRQLYDRDGKTCDYCKISEADFLRIWGPFYGGKTRGRVLEVDRKASKGPYTEDNCVLACAICNNAKSDMFDYDEFKEVGEAIEGIWRAKQRRMQGSS